MLNNDTEIALEVFNLFDKKHNEYPLDTSDVRRRVMVSLMYAF